MPTSPPHRLWFFSWNFSGLCLSKALLFILSPLATPGLCRFFPGPCFCLRLSKSLAVVQVQEQYSVSVAWQKLIELHSLVITWEAPEFSLFCVCLGFASTMLMERGPEHIFDGQGNLKSPTVLTQHLRSTEYFCLVSTAT